MFWSHDMYQDLGRTSKIKEMVSWSEWELINFVGVCWIVLRWTMRDNDLLKEGRKGNCDDADDDDDG